MTRTVVAVALLLAACGGGGANAVAVQAAAGESDEAVRLAARLPRGARECVAVRADRLSATERRGLRWVSRALPLAWAAELDVSAYASAAQVSAAGER